MGSILFLASLTFNGKLLLARALNRSACFGAARFRGRRQLARLLGELRQHAVRAIIFLESSDRLLGCFAHTRRTFGHRSLQFGESALGRITLDGVARLCLALIHAHRVATHAGKHTADLPLELIIANNAQDARCAAHTLVSWLNAAAIKRVLRVSAKDNGVARGQFEFRNIEHALHARLGGRTFLAVRASHHLRRLLKHHALHRILANAGRDLDTCLRKPDVITRIGAHRDPRVNNDRLILNRLDDRRRGRAISNGVERENDLILSSNAVGIDERQRKPRRLDRCT